jgi:hypothetical protein
MPVAEQSHCAQHAPAHELALVAVGDSAKRAAGRAVKNESSANLNMITSPKNKNE